MTKQRYQKIVVLWGGTSSEREISLKTGQAVKSALESLGYAVSVLDPQDEKFVSMLMALKPDAVFNCLHGEYGEDGCLQGLLESLKLPYTGSGVKASAFCFNKLASKGLVKAMGYLTAESLALLMPDLDRLKKWIDQVLLPIVIKPNSQGSSIGVSLVRNMSQLEKAVEEAFSKDSVVLAEKFIAGREVTVGVLDRQPFPVVEIKPHGEFYDFQSKYQSGGSSYLVPAPLEPHVAQKLQAISLDLARLFQCAGAARFDYILTPANDVYFLEANTVPGMTATSLLPKGAQAIDLSFAELVDQIVQGAKCQKY